MPLFVDPVYTPGIAQLSYLIGDGSEGVAAVIDPRPDCDVYLHRARELGLAIRAVFETHNHADFLSGARELSARLGGIPIHASGVGDPDYGFDVSRIGDGETFVFGDLELTAKHTPGHTPEHLSYLLAESGADAPFVVFSGDTLFVDSVGRPDLSDEDDSRELAAKLHKSIYDFYAKLDDGVILYPGHGAGSACGPDIGDRMWSTIGYEKAHNQYLQIADKDAFIDKILSSAPPEPTHYRPMKKLNLRGPKIFGGTPPIAPLPPDEFRKRVEAEGACVLDTREPLAFGAGHIPGALSVAARPELSPWTGWMLGFDAPIYLVMYDDTQAAQVVNLLWRTGHTNVRGYLAGGMTAWIMQGYHTAQIEQMDVHRLNAQLGDFQLLDVRAPDERESGYIPTSKHIFVPEVRKKAGRQFDKQKPIATYCASGFRASIAASILKQEGFKDVRNVPGSFGAWTAAGYGTEKPEEGK